MLAQGKARASTAMAITDVVHKEPMSKGMVTIGIQICQLMPIPYD
jgi:hypothetical protein